MPDTSIKFIFILNKTDPNLKTGWVSSGIFFRNCRKSCGIGLQECVIRSNANFEKLRYIYNI